jgi:peptidyl-prolyl cis-trans isomerase C
MTISKFGILLAAAASVLALAGCNATDPAPGKDPVAATVNGTPISERFVAFGMKQYTERGRAAGPEVRSGIIDRLTMQVLISQEAVKKGLDKVPEISDKLELNRQSILLEAYIQDFVKNNPVGDDALKAEYEKFTAQAAGKEYKARHILVDGEAEAKDIIAKLKKNPKAFEALAAEKSKDRGSKINGGDLGWFDPRGMVPEFGNAVTQLANGKLTEEPVKSQFGYHVILLEDSRPKQVPTLEQVKPELAQQMQQQSLKKMLDELKAKAKIEVVAAPAAGPAPAKAVEPAEPAKK